MKQPSMKLRWKQKGHHIHVTVFMGVDDEHLVCSGNLVLILPDWDRLKAILLEGNDPNKCNLHFSEDLQ